jgi:hypothetical protein
MAYDVLTRKVMLRDSTGTSLVPPHFAGDIRSQDVARAAAPRDDVLRWIRSDFDEMPDLRVTEEQAARLWGIPTEDARTGLMAMVACGYLTRIGSIYARQPSR